MSGLPRIIPRKHEECPKKNQISVIYLGLEQSSPDQKVASAIPVVPIPEMSLGKMLNPQNCSFSWRKANMLMCEWQEQYCEALWD